jgi:hypothetical protein
MINYFLDSTWFTDIPLNLKIGNVLAIYTDDGPIGICGQSMSITAPHTYISLFNSYDEFQKEYSKIGRKGKNAKIRWVEIGNASSEGVFSLSIQE